MLSWHSRHVGRILNLLSQRSKSLTKRARPKPRPPSFCRTSMRWLRIYVEDQTNFIIRKTSVEEGKVEVETTRCTNLRCSNGPKQVRSMSPSRRLLMCTQGLKGGIIKSMSGPGSICTPKKVICFPWKTLCLAVCGHVSGPTPYLPFRAHIRNLSGILQICWLLLCSLLSVTWHNLNI